MTPAKRKAAAKSAAKGGRVTPKKLADPVPLKLDIACGQVKGHFDHTGQQNPDGWTGIDICATDAADIVHDLNQYPWPIADDSVDEARCSHYIEHTPHEVTYNGERIDGLIAFMNELWRILKPGGTCQIIAPYYSSMRAWQDPTHRRAISEMTFHYFKQEWLIANRLDHYPITADFFTSWGYNPNARLQGRTQEFGQVALATEINAVDDIVATMTKLVTP